MSPQIFFVLDFISKTERERERENMWKMWNVMFFFNLGKNMKRKKILCMYKKTKRGKKSNINKISKERWKWENWKEYCLEILY